MRQKIIVLDVANNAHVKTWAYQLLTDYAPPDLLINNAALISHLAPTWQIPNNEFSRLINSNVKGVAKVFLILSRQ